jgi:hypothetical protein
MQLFSQRRFLGRSTGRLDRGFLGWASPVRISLQYGRLTLCESAPRFLRLQNVVGQSLSRRLLSAAGTRRQVLIELCPADSLLHPVPAAARNVTTSIGA